MSPNLEFRMAGGQLERRGVRAQLPADRAGLPAALRAPAREQEEIYLLVGGSAQLKLDDEIVDLEPWDAVRIAKDTVRNLEAGSDGAELVLFGAPKADRRRRRDAAGLVG